MVEQPAAVVAAAAKLKLRPGGFDDAASAAVLSVVCDRDSAYTTWAEVAANPPEALAGRRACSIQDHFKSLERRALREEVAPPQKHPGWGRVARGNAGKLAAAAAAAAAKQCVRGIPPPPPPPPPPAALSPPSSPTFQQSLMRFMAKQVKEARLSNPRTT